MTRLKLSLDEKSFEDLVNGKIITINKKTLDEHYEIQIALQDIGYVEMLDTMLKTYKNFLDAEKMYHDTKTNPSEKI